MSVYGMRLRDVEIAPYFQRYFDTRPLAPARGEMFTRPDTTQPTDQFFSALETKEHVHVLAWLLEVAADLRRSKGIQSSINVDRAIVATQRGRNDFLRIAAAAECPVTFEFSDLPVDWTPDEVNKLFVQIRDREHQTALDNFGRDDKEFVSIRQVEFDTVKISGAVTAGLETDTRHQDQLERIFEALSNAGMQHVVQGVESQAAFQWLQELGYTTFQGFWFSIPAPAETLVHGR